MVLRLTHALADIDLKTVILVFGAIWALYKMVQRGTLRRVLDLRVSARLVQENNRQFLLCSLKAENVHIPKVRIEYCALQVSSMGEIGGYSEPPTWADFKPVQVFRGHKKVRADETIRDEILLPVPPNEQVFDVFFKTVAKLHWYQLPIRPLLKMLGLERFSPNRTRWNARIIVDRQGSTPEVKNEGNHPGRRRGNGRGNEEVEGPDREADREEKQE